VPARVVRKDMLHNGSALDHLITALRGASSWEIFFGWVRLTYYSGSAYLLNGWLKFTGRGAAVGDLGGTNQPARPFAQTWSEPRRPADKLFDRHEDRVPDLALDVLR
jgi:hypothetical protein